MTLKFLGTGTSQGVPVIGSHHPVCLSTDPRDKRLRASAMLTTDEGRKILIDCGPDFRQQMLANGENDVHAVLITHEHNDHVIGLDDLRPVIFKNDRRMPLYCSPRVAKEIEQRFPYAFAKVWYPGAPTFDLRIIDRNFHLFDTEILPLDIMHGKLPILGFKVRNLAYLTDCNGIPKETMAQLYNLDYLIINCLRKHEAHHSHFTLKDVVPLVEVLRPKKTYLTHMSHHIGFHAALEKELPEGILPAYDGLEIIF